MNRDLQKLDHLIENGEIRKAESQIAKQLRANPTPEAVIQLLLRRARLRLTSARPDEALSDLAEIATLSHSSSSPEVLELTGDCYLARFEMAIVGFASRNDIEAAEEIYTTILNEFPRYANLGWIYYQLGRIRVTTGDIESATHYFHQSLVSPTTVNTLTAYAYERLAFIAFYESRDAEQAVAFLSRAVATYPVSAERNWLIQVQLLRSRVLRAQNDHQTALVAAETALSIVAGSRQTNKTLLAEVLLTAAELKSDLGGHDREIIQLLQQFMQAAKKPLGVDVTWARANEMLGNAYFNVGQYDSAIEAYQTVFQFNPDYPWEVALYYRIAQGHYQQRRYEASVQMLYHMIEAAQNEQQAINDYHVYDMLGNGLFALGRYEHALEAYHTALEIAPANADNRDTIQSYHDRARALI